MATITVEGEKLIARPLDVVQSQFVDMHHHATTRVRTKVEMPVSGVLRLLAPLVRLGLKRDLDTALEEDRRDLEERGYPRA